jgi:chromosome segregation ATPase
MVRVLLPVLLAGCASQTEVQAVRADTVALERQGSAQHQTIGARVQQLSDRLTEIERAQAATRRDLARVAAMVDEVRGQMQRLQGAFEETQHELQSAPTVGEGVTATRLARLDARLRALAKQLAVAPE